MQIIDILGTPLQLLAEKAVYLEQAQTLLVADVHLGKSDTFQRSGIPIPNTINQETLDRLYSLCLQVQPQQLIILGDLFHSKWAFTDEVSKCWQQFTQSIPATVKLLLGNHDRQLTQPLTTLGIDYATTPIELGSILLSHEPLQSTLSSTTTVNICGHVHPCIRLKTRLDDLRLPCFYLETSPYLLVLPSFGSFTGGFEVTLKANAIAYAIVENTVLPLRSTN